VRSKKIEAALVERLPLYIAKQDDPHYQTLWQAISPAQRSILVAFAKNPDGLPFSRDFQFRHKGVSSPPTRNFARIQYEAVLEICV
jgi:hypothetical protein